VESGAWFPQEMTFVEMPTHFGYVLRPVALLG
jgi:hypothetical protein